MVALGRGNIEKLSGLHRVLSWSNGFSLSIVVVEDQETRSEVLGWIERWTKNDGGPPIYDLQLISGTRIIPELHRMKTSTSGPFGVVLSGLEATTVSEFIELNIHREELPSILDGPMIVVASESAVRALVEDAPDFFSWRTYMITIEGHPRRQNEKATGSSGTDFSTLILLDPGPLAEVSADDIPAISQGSVGDERWVLLDCARVAWIHGNRTSEGQLVEATEWFARSQDQQGLLSAAGLLANVLKTYLKSERARATLARARSIIKDEIQRAMFDLLDASILLQLSNHIEAEDRIRSALNFLVSKGHPSDEQAFAHSLLAQIATRRGHVEAAATHIKSAYHLSASERHLSLDLQSATIHLRRGNLSRAEGILAKIHRSEHISFWQRIEHTLALCESYLRRHQWSRTEALLQRLETSRANWEATTHEVSILRIRGEISLGNRDTAGALLNFMRAQQIAASADAIDVRMQGLLQLGIARTQLLGGRLHESAVTATEAYQNFMRGDDVALKAECELVLGRVFRALGRSSLARSYFARALVGFGRLGDRLGEAECDDQRGSLMLFEHSPQSSDFVPEDAWLEAPSIFGSSSEDLPTLRSEELQNHDLGEPTPRVRDLETIRSLFESALTCYKEVQRFADAARVAENLAHITPLGEIQQFYYNEARRLRKRAEANLPIA